MYFKFNIYKLATDDVINMKEKLRIPIYVGRICYRRFYIGGHYTEREGSPRAARQTKALPTFSPTSFEIDGRISAGILRHTE